MVSGFTASFRLTQLPPDTHFNSWHVRGIAARFVKSSFYKTD